MCKLLAKRFDILKELGTILQIPYKATEKLQLRSLTLSDTFGIFKKMELILTDQNVLRKFKTNFAKCLLNSLTSRSETIFHNPAMACALYLDPRFRREITKNEEKTNATIDMLVNLFKRIQVIKGPSVSVAIPEATPNNSGASNCDIDFDNPAILQNYLDDLNFSSGSAPLPYQPFDSLPQLSNNIDIRLILETFQPEKILATESVVSFWESKKNDEKSLYELATVIFAIPPTEVQIERDFSKLDYIFTQRRSRLSADILEKILFMHLNKDLFYVVKNEELAKF